MSPRIVVAGEHSCWLLLTTRSYWANLQAIREWAFAKRGNRGPPRIAEEDTGIVYLRAEYGQVSALGGIIEFQESPSERTRTESIFDRLYPIRAKIRILGISDPPIPFKPFVNQMSFIRNKSNWGMHLQGNAARRLDKWDCTVLTHAIQASTRRENNARTEGTEDKHRMR